MNSNDRPPSPFDLMSIEHTDSIPSPFHLDALDDLPGLRIPSPFRLDALDETLQASFASSATTVRSELPSPVSLGDLELYLHPISSQAQPLNGQDIHHRCPSIATESPHSYQHHRYSYQRRKKLPTQSVDNSRLGPTRCESPADLEYFSSAPLRQHTSQHVPDEPSPQTLRASPNLEETITEEDRTRYAMDIWYARYNGMWMPSIFPPSFIDLPRTILDEVCSKAVDRQTMTFSNFANIMDHPDEVLKTYDRHADILAYTFPNSLGFSGPSTNTHPRPAFWQSSEDVEHEDLPGRDDVGAKGEPESEDDSDIDDDALRLSASLYKRGYAFWRSRINHNSSWQGMNPDARMQCQLWSNYLQCAGGLWELLVADTRSVQPGLWNDRWELPLPYIPRPRFVKPYPPYRISYVRAAAEVALRITSLRSRISEILGRTSSVFGYDALLAHEELERAFRSG